jgi:shikimate kinase
VNARVKISVSLVEMSVPYVLKIKVKDAKAKLVFETGTFDDSHAHYYYGKYPPSNNMPEVLREYELIRKGIEQSLTTASSLDEF